MFEQNLQVYGADKVRRQLHRKGLVVARCTVERLMRRAGLRGARRGKAVRTTVPETKAACPLDRVNRQFRADRPNQLWVADFTYVSTWKGFVYMAFRHRRARALHRGLAGQQFDGDRLRARCAGRDHQRAVQGRGHPPARALEDARGGRVGRAGMGCRGSTTIVCWSPSATSRPPSSSRTLLAHHVVA